MDRRDKVNQPIVGYLVNHPAGVHGEKGLGYDYLLAGNGLFIHAANDLLVALVPVAECQVRGLAPETPRVSLPHGKIPQVLFDLALSTIIVKNDREVYLALTWKDGYHLFLTNQEGTAGSVKYAVLPNTLLDIHSHTGKLTAFFSGQDNADETGLQLSCVIGNLQETPALRVRACVYGNFYEIPWSDVFDGALRGAVDRLTETETVPEEALPVELTKGQPDSFWQRIRRLL